MARLSARPWTPERWRALAIAWGATGLLVGLGAIAVYTFLAYRTAAAQLVIERDLQLAYLAAARLEDELSKFSAELTALARSPDVQITDPVRQREALYRARLRLSVFDGGVVLLGANGRIVTSEPLRTGDIGRDWSDKPYFRQLLGSTQVLFTDTDTDGPGRTPAVVLSVPVVGASGELRGALIGMFRLGQATISPFYASIVRLRIGQSGTTYVVGTKGQILFDSEVEHVGEAFSERGLPGVTLGPVGGAVRTVDAAGHAVLAAHVPIPGTPWWLVTEDDWATLTSSTNRYLRILLAVLGAGMLVPAAGVAMLARQHSVSVAEREHSDYEADVAQLIQRTLLPRGVPTLPGWRVTSAFDAADRGPCAFFDWILLPDGSLAVSLGDVTEKRAAAVPIMATARAALRSAALRGLSPGAAFQEANQILCADMPAGIAVSCLHARLDPVTGSVVFAAAGHPGPVLCTGSSLQQFNAPGRRLGRELDATYAENGLTVLPGQIALFCSAGLLGGRSPSGAVFGATRLPVLAAQHRGAGRELVPALQADLRDFVGRGRSLEADVTLMVLERVDPFGSDPDVLP